MVKKQTVFALGEVKEAEKEIFIENYINEFYLFLLIVDSSTQL